MAYQSQLVVRTKDQETTQLVEKVKEMADEQGKTYSEMALELLTLGLDAYDGGQEVSTSTSAPAKSNPKQRATGTTDTSSASAEATKDNGGTSAAAVADAVDWDLAADGKKDDEPPELPGERLDPSELPDTGEPDVVAEACLEQLEEENRAAAIQILARFFEEAGPVEGGQVKDKLQEALGESGYETLLEALRQTQEYRDYRKRVIFG